MSETKRKMLAVPFGVIRDLVKYVNVEEIAQEDIVAITKEGEYTVLIFYAETYY